MSADVADEILRGMQPGDEKSRLTLQAIIARGEHTLTMSDDYQIAVRHGLRGSDLSSSTARSEEILARLGENGFDGTDIAWMRDHGLNIGDTVMRFSLEQVRPWFEGLAIETKQMAFRGEKPLYRRVAGDAFDRLPDATRQIHRGRPAVIAEGEAVVAPADNAVGRFIARLVGVPGTEGRQPLRVVIESREGREHWTRFFADRPMRSVMSAAGDGLIEERFGAIANLWARRPSLRAEQGTDAATHGGI